MEIDIQNREKQLRKGLVEYLLLLVLQKKPQYTAEIIGQLKAANFLVVEGTLYPLLNRMRKQGLVSYVWEEAKTGHPRKYYALTDVGEQVLQQLRKVWQGIENTVHLLQN